MKHSQPMALKGKADLDASPKSYAVDSRDAGFSTSNLIGFGLDHLPDAYKPIAHLFRDAASELFVLDESFANRAVAEALESLARARDKAFIALGKVHGSL